MGKLLSTFSAIKSAFLKADIEISPVRSFEAIVEFLELLFGVEFSSTDRFDEFPAKIAEVDHHEIVLFGMPEGELEGDEDYQFYRLSIYPQSSPASAGIEDASEFFVSKLRAAGIESRISP